MNNDAEVISKFKDMGLSERTDMIERELSWIPDSNGSAYNGQLTFDLSCFGQTNKWLSYSEAYIQIPYVVAIKASVDYTAPGLITAGTIAMKDGFHQIIDSIAVEWNQSTLVQVQNFTNVHTQFKLLTSCSASDAIKNSPTNGFFGDDVDSMTYKSVADTTGIGYINNGNGYVANRKEQTTAFDVVAEAAALPTINADKTITAGRSYYKKDEGAGAARIYYWVCMATIRLGDITDFFYKIPLCKTTDVRLIITYNSAQAVVNVAADDKLTLDSYQQISGHTCPFMLCPLTTPATGTLTIRSNILKSGLGETPVTAISNCRLYVPLYRIRDAVALAMVQSFPTTKFVYNDIYTYVVPEITSGSSFVHTLSTGIVNPKYVVVIPFPKTNSLAGLGVATYQSVWDTAPGTSSAITIADFNVQLAGLNVMQSNEHYDWEQFFDQLSKINAINGNNVLGLTSGLINYHSFQQGYRMYVCDLSRREPSQDNVIKSIVITGVNTMAASIELICFVAYEKSAMMNTATGTMVV